MFALAIGGAMTTSQASFAMPIGAVIAPESVARADWTCGPGWHANAWGQCQRNYWGGAGYGYSGWNGYGYGGYPAWQGGGYYARPTWRRRWEDDDDDD